MPRGRPNEGPKLVALKKRGWREAVFYIRWSEGGRSRERSTGCVDRGDAEKIFGRWLVEERGAPQRADTGPRHPAEALIADMLALYAERHAPGLADPARAGFAIDRLLAFWGDRHVDAVTPETCREYVNVRKEQFVREPDENEELLPGKIKISTASKELSFLRAALNWTRKNGYLTSAPFVELPPRQPGRDRWLTRSEVARLLWEARKSPRARLHLPLYVLIAVYTGARPGAILGLRWSQIDFMAGRIDFNEPGRPRTNKRRPIIPIPRSLRAALLRAHRRAGLSPYVISFEGKRIRDIGRAFMTACVRAGLGRDVMPYTLRHTAGTWMALRGVDLHQIGGWLGHTNARTTELYAHHSPDYFEAAKKAMERR